MSRPGEPPHRRGSDARSPSVPGTGTPATGTGTSVGVRLTRALGLVVVLLLLVGASGAGGLLVTGHSRARETELRALQAANSALQLTLTEADTSLRDYRTSADPALLTRHDDAVAALPALRRHAADLATDPLQTALLDEQARLSTAWVARTEARTSAGVPAAGAPAQDVTANDLVEAARRAGDRLDVLVRTQQQEAATTENRVRTGALTVTALTLLAALAVVVNTGVRTRRALVDPLRQLVGVLAALSRGDRVAGADPARGPSEVRSVARAVNDLARENDRLLTQAEESARLQRLAGDVGRAVRDQLVAEDAVATAVRALGEALSVDRVWVRLLTDGGLGPVAQEWARSPLPPLPAAARSGAVHEDSLSWVQELHVTGSAHVVEDTRAVRGQHAGLDAFLRSSSARALLLVPIGSGDQPHGLLTVLVGDGPRAWTPHEVDLVRSVAVDLARALVLAGLYRAQERLLAELREVESVKSDLLATVSHELRTPLTSITGYLDLLTDGAAGPVPDDVAAVLDVVGRNAQRLTALIEDLLLLSRVESAPADPGRGSTAVTDLVAGAREVTATSAGPGARLVCAPAGPEVDDLRVRGEGEHLHRALRAVVDNAWKFSPPGAAVRLRVERVDSEVRILVSDNGMGIPVEEVEAVFGRFARGSNAVTAAVPGTGLGLTIARDLVRLHGGRVSLDSVLERGTTVTLHLQLLPRPGSPADGPPDDAAPATAPPDAAAPAHHGTSDHGTSDHDTTDHDTADHRPTLTRGGTW